MAKKQFVYGHGLKTVFKDGTTHIETDTVDSLNADKTLPVSGIAIKDIVDKVETILESI